MGSPFKGVSDRVAEHNRVMQQWMVGYSTGSERPRGDSRSDVKTRGFVTLSFSPVPILYLELASY